MIGLDSNVLVRYLAQDDAAQAARASRLIERELTERVPGFISLVVLVETCWVLKRLYHVTPAEMLGTVRDLLEAQQIVIEHRGAVTRALERANGGDIADALIAEIAHQAGCTRVVTFDRNAARFGMTLLS